MTKLAQSPYSYLQGIYISLLAEIIERDPRAEMRDGFYLSHYVRELTLEDVMVKFPGYDKELLKTLEKWPDVGDDYVVAFCMGFPIEEFKHSFTRSVMNGHAELVRLYRTFLKLSYKLKIAHTNDQEKTAYTKFCDNNQGCYNRDHQVGGYDSGAYSVVTRLARKIVQSVCTPSMVHERIIPSHGPGAVYERHKAWNKCTEACYYEAAEKQFPACEHLAIDYFHYLEIVGLANNLTWQATGPLWWEKEIPCRLSFVPKDSRGPRTICTHPTNIMMVQQGQRRILQTYIERHVGAKIALRDQTLNASRAATGYSAGYGTIDLSDASDTVSVGLVRNLFGDEVFEWLSSTRANVCEYKRNQIPLYMFAPMGSALCFPVECLVFYAIVGATVELLGGDSEEVYVYGDDIIVENQWVPAVMDVLQWYGFRPNLAKSYWRGLFRESCGYDALGNSCITPLQLKEPLTSEQVLSWGSCADAARRAYELGWTKVATAMAIALEQTVGYGRLPVIPYGTTGVGYLVEPRRSYESKRCWSEYLQKPMTRTLHLFPRTSEVRSHAREHVRDALLELELKYNGLNPMSALIGDAIIDGHDPGYSLPKAVRAEYGWTPAP